MPKEKTYLQYFCYSTGWITLAAAAGAVGTATLSILADANFMARYMTIAVKQANVLVTNWGGSLQINDSGVGRDLINIATAVQAFQGSGQLPYPFDPPRVFARNSGLVITFTNNVATETHVQLVLHGSKVFKTLAEFLGEGFGD